jgi:aspartate/methionine/tyrosine aminotransferase
MLEGAGGDFTNVVAFQSLSKRSNLPGMRVGFAAGDKKFLLAFHELRNVAAPQVPVPLQQVAVAAYSDEAHVEENRRLYRMKFDLADQILGNRYGYHRPAGGFCVWLDVSAHGGDEAVTIKLYKDAGVRVLPGSYLARQQADGFNPGDGYIRLALVQDSETIAEALHRLVQTLDSRGAP